MRLHHPLFWAGVILLLVPPPVRAGDSADAVLREAARAFSDGHTKQAQALVRKAIVLDPRSAEAHVLLGRVADALGDHHGAVAAFRRVLQLDPKRVDVLDLLGSSLFKLGDFTRSLASFDRFLELQPERKTGHWRRGITCYYAKRFDEGRKQFERYETVDTNDVENAVWRYLCMAPKAGVEKARAAMLKIGKDRRVPMTEVYELFCGRLKPADVLKAVAADNPSAAQLNRRRFYAHLYLGLYYESLGDAKRALRHLTTATEHRIGHYMWDVARVHRDLLRKAGK